MRTAGQIKGKKGLLGQFWDSERHTVLLRKENGMATFEQRGPRQWRARVRRPGYPSQSETFETKAAAQEWAAQIEATMARGSFVDQSNLDRFTLGDLLEQYQETVTVTKRSAEAETYRIRVLLKLPMARRRLSQLTAADFTEYRNERLKLVRESTVRKDLLLLSAILNTARMDWAIPVCNWTKGHLEKPRFLPAGKITTS